LTSNVTLKAQSFTYLTVAAIIILASVIIGFTVSENHPSLDYALQTLRTLAIAEVFLLICSAINGLWRSKDD
jgi:hypothetical protein